MIGIYALADPLRDEIVSAVKICHNAGINIRMVTGDNLDTAKAIAIEAGILRQRDMGNLYACMDGKSFREAIGGLKKLEGFEGSEFIKEEIVNK